MTAPSDLALTPLAALAAVIRGDRLSADVWSDAALVALAEQHGVGPLLVERLRESGVGPPRDALAAFARDAAALDLVREAELRRAIASLVAHEVPFLVFKGEQLAHDVYTRPDLRPRVDSDLLVPQAHRDAAHAALIAQGYERVPQFTGELVAYQAPYVMRRQGRITHIIDLHWRVANPQQFGTVLSTEELFADAVDLPALAPGARGLGPVHALVIACTHPVAHHRGEELLIWTYDVHLLSRCLSSEAWERFATLVLDRGIAQVCGHSLRRAVETFATPVPDTVVARLTRSAEAEATASFLARERRHIQTIWGDLRTLSTWRERWRLVHQHAFPPRDYMRQVYAPSSAAPLMMLYARRMYRGARKWLART